MKKWTLVLAMVFVLAIAGFVQAGPYTRSLSVFPHTNEKIIIPDSGCTFVPNGNIAHPYYEWQLKTQDEYCGTSGTSVQCNPTPPPCNYRKVCSRVIEESKEDPSVKEGEGTNPPWLNESEKTCFDVKEDTVFFGEDINPNIVCGIPGGEVDYQKLVVQSCIGATVQVSGAGHTFAPVASLKTRFVVWKLADKLGQLNKRLLVTAWQDTPVDANGMFYADLTNGYTFGPIGKHDGSGVYMFKFQVRKLDKTIGTTAAKVMVFNCAD
jgi:hypothetical protein